VYVFPSKYNEQLEPFNLGSAQYSPLSYFTNESEEIRCSGLGGKIYVPDL
jgi:hypothetical protein